MEKSNNCSERKIFTAKLHELDRQCCAMHERLCRCQQADKDVLHEEITQLINESQIMEDILQKRATESHSTIALQIAQVQQEYNIKIKDILGLDIFVREYKCEKTVSEESAESMTLYAEYAADFAMQAIQRSLLAMLYAIEMQIMCEE